MMLPRNRCHRTSNGFGRNSAFPATIASSPSAFCCGPAVVGAISLEVFGQYGADTLTDPAAVFDAQVRLLVDVLTQPDASLTGRKLERVHWAFPAGSG